MFIAKKNYKKGLYQTVLYIMHLIYDDYYLKAAWAAANLAIGTL